ncbi:ATP-binding protein [Kitasatospora sp. NPDC058965]|uniref:ATP-binding protein n=1 Tax=Kitasatospora sp. NPDC058965 TaxID=3346682 RepID=UPI003675D582
MPADRMTENLTAIGSEAGWVVNADPAAVSTARRRALAAVESWGTNVPTHVADTIRGVVSELVTNAVIHAGKAGPITLVVWRTPRGNLAVVVRDGSPEPPVLGDAYDNGQHGHGLALVAVETIAWGSRPEAGGKAVFATIALPGATTHRTAGMPAERTRNSRPTRTEPHDSALSPACP